MPRNGGVSFKGLGLRLRKLAKDLGFQCLSLRRSFATIVLGPLSTQQLRNSQRNRASNRAPPDGATGACKAIPSVETEAGKTHDAMMTAIEHAFGSLTPLLQEYGVTAVMIILMLELIGLPLPGELVLILASVLAARGDLSFPFLLVFAWAGAVLGDNIGYVIGRTFGRAVLLRVGGRIGLKADRVRKVEDVFALRLVTVGFACSSPSCASLTALWPERSEWSGRDFCCLTPWAARSGCSSGRCSDFISALTSATLREAGARFWDGRSRRSCSCRRRGRLAQMAAPPPESPTSPIGHDECGLCDPCPGRKNRREPMEVLSVAKASASHIDRKGLRDDAPAREGQEGRPEISWSLWRDLGGVAVQGLDGLWVAHAAAAAPPWGAQHLDIESHCPLLVWPKGQQRPDYVDELFYRALVDGIREALCFGPSTTTTAPIPTRL